MPMPTRRDAALGELVRKYRGGMSQTTVADLVSRELEGDQTVTQGQVSDHESGRRWSGNPDLPGAYGRALNIPQDELYTALGLPPPSAATKALTFAEIVERDPTLSKAAKDHLLNQYGLLQAASAHERASRNHPQGAKRSSAKKATG